MASPEDLFTVTKHKFDEAYSVPTHSSLVGLRPSEMINGRQPDGTPIGIFRPNIELEASLGSMLFSLILGDPTIAGDTSEFVVHGSDGEDTIGFEVIRREPLETRTLSPSEMTDLAAKITGSVFH